MTVEQKFFINGQEVEIKEIPDEYLGHFLNSIRIEARRRRREYLIKTIKEQLNE